MHPLIIPSHESEALTTVQFGVRVTNLSATPYRFIVYGLLPEFLDKDGNIMKQDGGCNRSPYLEPSDFLLVTPGNNAIYCLEGKLCFSNNSSNLAEQFGFSNNSSNLENRKLSLGGHDSKGCWFWALRYLYPLTYEVRFTYQRSPQKNSRVH